MGLLLIALLPTLPVRALAQGAQDRDSIEPGVATSGAAQPPRTPPGAAPPSAPAPTTPGQPTPKSPPKAASKAAAPAPSQPAAAGQPSAPGKANDRLELDPTQISGNRELPRVMYVVPWRRPDLGEFAGRPPNSLLDEVLAPVDRDVFRRQNSYYSALQPDTPPAARKDEK
jgi:hypothetical protein